MLKVTRISFACASILALGTACSTTTMAQGEPDYLATAPSLEDELAGPSGTYGGSYRCQDGEHGFYLELTTMDTIIDPDENGVQQVVGYNVDAIIGFFPTLAGRDGPSGMVAGSFHAEGIWMVGDSGINLQPRDWITQPEGYGAAELQGMLTEIAPGQWQLTGRPIVPGNPGFCSDLIATQFAIVG